MYENEEIEEIHHEFKRKELLEHALGPSVSLIIHVVLFLALFFLVTTQFHKDEDKALSITIVQEPLDIEIDPPKIIDSIDKTALTPSELNDEFLPEEPVDDDINTAVESEPSEFVDSQLEAFNIENPIALPAKTPQGKAQLVKKSGGSEEALPTVLSALKWLRSKQNPDGSWGENHQNAMTALATLLLLAHGETPESKHFGRTTQKALQWLSQAVNDGRKDRDRHEYGYAIMVYALAEAYALTSIPPLKDAMEKGLNRILSGYQKHGGFEYNFSKGGSYDLSFSGWSFQAIKASYLAGSNNPKLRRILKEIPEKMIKSVGYKLDGSREVNAFYYKQNRHIGAAGGKGVYEKSSGMRAVGALVLQLYGKKDLARPAAKLIRKHDLKSLKWDTAVNWPLYAWYYATQVMYNNKSHSPKAWTKWNIRFQKMLYETQNRDGHWDIARNKSKAYHGMTDIDRKVYSTALSGLMLTVYYRYLEPTKLEPIKKSKTYTADSQVVDIDMLF